jgi:hypothetical protein
MGGQPLLDFGGLVDLGVVGDDGEVSKERRRVGAIKRLQQVKEKPGLLTLPHTRGEGAGRANALKLLSQQDFKQVVWIERTRETFARQTLGARLLA